MGINTLGDGAPGGSDEGKNRWWSRLRTIPSTPFSPPPRRLRFLWRGLSQEDKKARVRTYGLISGNTRLNRLTSQRELLVAPQSRLLLRLQSPSWPSLTSSMWWEFSLSLSFFFGSILSFWNTLKDADLNLNITFKFSEILKMWKENTASGQVRGRENHRRKQRRCRSPASLTHLLLPHLCSICRAVTQAWCWQLRPSEGTCSWWLFALLPVQRSASALLYSPLHLSPLCLAGGRPVCGSIGSAWRPEAASLSVLSVFLTDFFFFCSVGTSCSRLFSKCVAVWLTPCLSQQSPASLPRL